MHPSCLQPRTAILVTVIGTVYEDAMHGYRQFEQKVAARYPNNPISWAISSDKVRKRLKDNGQEALSITEALTILRDKGFCSVALQSLHTIAGLEFKRIVEEAETFENENPGFRVVPGRPLLETEDDMRKASSVLATFLPAQRDAGQAHVLIGHGTRFEGKELYARFREIVEADHEHVLMGVLVGQPNAREVAKTLVEKGYACANLVPLMSVAGYHVREDMFGDTPKAWAAVFRELGITPVPVQTGTTECEAFQDMWLANLGTAMSSLACCNTNN